MRVDELDYFAFSYLNMTLNEFVEYIESPRNKIRGSVETVHDDVVNVLGINNGEIVTLQKYRTSSDLAYMYMYSRSWIVFISSAIDGWQSLVWSISKNTNKISYSFKLDKGKKYLSCINSFVFNNGSKVEERVVQALIDDGKWRFYENGPLQQFESQENYRRRRIKDRVNYSILWEYCQRLGIDIAREGFLHPETESIVFERRYHTQ